jgi:hypothetical protein
MTSSNLSNLGDMANRLTPRDSSTSFSLSSNTSGQNLLDLDEMGATRSDREQERQPGASRTLASGAGEVEMMEMDVYYPSYEELFLDNSFPTPGHVQDEMDFQTWASM